MIGAKPVSGMARITHTVAAAMTVSSILAIADMGTTYQLQQRRVCGVLCLRSKLLYNRSKIVLNPSIYIESREAPERISKQAT